MKKFLKATMAAAALAGAAFFAASPAQAQIGFGYSWSGPDGAIGFSYDSGGYCDAFGCPDAYWDMPVYYGPVYYRGTWYRGPVYYRDWRGERWYWIRGNWRRDEWRGNRPSWARSYRVGPALGFSFYERDRRFRIRDEYRRDRNRGDWNNRRDNDRRDWNRDNDRRDNNDRDRNRGDNNNRGDGNRGDRGDNNRGNAATDYPSNRTQRDNQTTTLPGGSNSSDPRVGKPLPDGSIYRGVLGRD